MCRGETWMSDLLECCFFPKTYRSDVYVVVEEGGKYLCNMFIRYSLHYY